ncbi:hypothetical protein BJ508DRAFT_334922 [Ascobolus immersus RN42]|uniref:Uncharacterized protein n=1 Tax=Ascobolus immersus RN42 TaxID=1160509 RepID=A0A3N4HIS3_ASCIM|nr:hypothetical protein BJ508DRAFT_334922 [Ascobolus immersus RN42]
MIFGGKATKQEALEDAGLYTSPVIPLNDANIKYVLWGSHALLLAFLVRSPQFVEPELAIVVSDDDFLRAIETLESHSYLHHKDRLKTGLLGAYSFRDREGEFPECAIFDYEGDFTLSIPSLIPKRKHVPAEGGLKTGASLLHFSFDNAAYIKSTTIQPEALGIDDTDSWEVAHPTLPGILNATLNLMRLYENSEYISPQQFLKMHADFIFEMVVLNSYPRKEVIRQYRTIEELPKKMKDVAGMISAENKDYYFLQLCIVDEETFQERQPEYDVWYDLDMLSDTDEEDTYEGESWEEVFGVHASLDEEEALL